MISHKYKCIFIHIPKTAGTSIEKSLEHFATFDSGVQDHRPLSVIEPLKLIEVYNHIRNQKKDVKSKCKIIKSYLYPPVTEKQYRTYFKFTFIRNPWSRAYSWYKDVMRWEPHQKELGIEHDCSFEEFIMGNHRDWAMKTQLHWMKNRKGRIEFDFIGRFENLSHDYIYVADRLGLSDYELPRILISDNQHYTNFYTDKLINSIAEKYEEEIELFNFRYGE